MAAAVSRLPLSSSFCVGCAAETGAGARTGVAPTGGVIPAAEVVVVAETEEEERAGKLLRREW